MKPSFLEEEREADLEVRVDELLAFDLVLFGEVAFVVDRLRGKEETNRGVTQVVVPVEDVFRISCIAVGPFLHARLPVL